MISNCKKQLTKNLITPTLIYKEDSLHFGLSGWGHCGKIQYFIIHHPIYQEIRYRLQPPPFLCEKLKNEIQIFEPNIHRHFECSVVDSM